MLSNFYVRFVIDIREGHEPSAFEVVMAIRELKRHKSPGIDQIQAELIKAGGGKVFLRTLNLLTLFGIGKKCLRSGSARSLNPCLRKLIEQNVVFIEAYRLVSYVQTFVHHPSLKFLHTGTFRKCVRSINCHSIGHNIS